MAERAAAQHAARVLAMARGSSAGVRDELDATVTRSWSRCLGDYGLDPVMRRDPLVLERAQFEDHRERVRDMLEIAQVEMDNLHQQIASSGSAIILTDAEGVILNCVTSPGMSRLFRRAGLWQGAHWDEEHEGTNGIGTCVIERRPVAIHRAEHFLSHHTGLSCAAAPIFAPNGQMLGVLDASSVNSRDSKQSQFHALAMATMSAKLIENCVFLRQFRGEWVLRFHNRPEFVGQLSEGMLAFDGAGRVLAANQSALGQLGLAAQDAATARTVSELFDVDFDTLLGRASQHPNTVWPLRGRRGQQFFAMLRGRELPATALRHALLQAPAERGSTTPLERARMDLAGLRGRDPLMAHNVRCAEKVVDRNITLLLHGETGTGKEAFAKAVHAVSKRATKPFVAVNCAAIPESLIESELFGYKAGAFTGARREGMRGKILQAHGGTLFLDEIGDMPPQLQTRLLRVLEEREILPLGAETPIPVDIKVISATHRNLDELVASGTFREDLYYRLNGLVLTLPALRERADLEDVIQRVLSAESEGQALHIAPEALALLTAYPWPGNIRQLRNVLRTAVALCEDGVVRAEDLPAELRRGPAAAAVRPAMVFEPAPEASPTPPHADPRRCLLDAEKSALLAELERHRWNMSNTARDLGVSRNTLYRKLHKHGITPPTLG
ncbi:transcriptional regulator of acetoin/glycerol metabolism [Plasticicumulans lactativorans]|uniref:Transcriptional regulator of acetoin/glycerol metabolism n=1 Tax=Plasticicumulans lactativorans TaxID=1133106 RepID=A0A4R2L399_9GAMM|nr:sigma-54-dependent Fis family transcriptional regulator [Plasticicumulans lactativorans]TCO80974.1 transcriptional regulator of acetoin/glycerol metabolism [Plasticicumulans lactativorans]